MAALISFYGAICTLQCVVDTAVLPDFDSKEVEPPM